MSILYGLFFRKNKRGLRFYSSLPSLQNKFNVKSYKYITFNSIRVYYKGWKCKILSTSILFIYDNITLLIVSIICIALGGKELDGQQYVELKKNFNQNSLTFHIYLHIYYINIPNITYYILATILDYFIYKIHFTNTSK